MYFLADKLKRQKNGNHLDKKVIVIVAVLESL